MLEILAPQAHVIVRHAIAWELVGVSRVVDDRGLRIGSGPESDIKVSDPEFGDDEASICLSNNRRADVTVTLGRYRAAGKAFRIHASLDSGEELVMGCTVLAFLDNREQKYNRMIHRALNEDPITGLVYKRGLADALDREWYRAGRSNTGFAVCRVRIDAPTPYLGWRLLGILRLLSDRLVVDSQNAVLGRLGAWELVIGAPLDSDALRSRTNFVHEVAARAATAEFADAEKVHVALGFADRAEGESVDELLDVAATRQC